MATLNHWFVEFWQDLEVWEKLRDPWVWFGLGAQALFFGRFLWQWIVSERRGHSTIPIAFWYLSLSGGGALFIYAWHQRDLVIMLGQLLACAIYFRNLMLIYGQARRRALAGLPKAKLRSEVSGENDSEARY